MLAMKVFCQRKLMVESMTLLTGVTLVAKVDRPMKRFSSVSDETMKGHSSEIHGKR